MMCEKCGSTKMPCSCVKVVPRPRPMYNQCGVCADAVYSGGELCSSCTDAHHDGYRAGYEAAREQAAKVAKLHHGCALAWVTSDAVRDSGCELANDITDDIMAMQPEPKDEKPTTLPIPVLPIDQDADALVDGMLRRARMSSADLAASRCHHKPGCSVTRVPPAPKRGKKGSK